MIKKYKKLDLKAFFNGLDNVDKAHWLITCDLNQSYSCTEKKSEFAPITQKNPQYYLGHVAVSVI